MKLGICEITTEENPLWYPRIAVNHKEITPLVYLTIGFVMGVIFVLH